MSALLVSASMRAQFHHMLWLNRPFSIACILMFVFVCKLCCVTSRLSSTSSVPDEPSCKAQYLDKLLVSNAGFSLD